MFPVSLEGLDEKDGLQGGVGDLCDFFCRLRFGDMKGVLAWVEVIGKSLHHSPVPEPNNDLVFYLRHQTNVYSFGHHELLSTYTGFYGLPRRIEISARSVP